MTHSTREGSASPKHVSKKESSDRLKATRNVQWRQPDDLQEEWQREFARALGVVELDDDEMSQLFADGVNTVRELEAKGQITGSTARQLLNTLGTLYVEALVSRLSRQVTGHREAMLIPHFVHWLIPGSK